MTRVALLADKYVVAPSVCDICASVRSASHVQFTQGRPGMIMLYLTSLSGCALQHAVRAVPFPRRCNSVTSFLKHSVAEISHTRRLHAPAPTPLADPRFSSPGTCQDGPPPRVVQRVQQGADHPQVCCPSSLDIMVLIQLYRECCRRPVQLCKHAMSNVQRETTALASLSYVVKSPRGVPSLVPITHMSLMDVYGPGA